MRESEAAKGVGGEASVHAAVTVEELLRGSKRCVVHFLGTLNRTETRAKFAVQGFGVVTHHIESAAFHRAFRAKRADNDVAARLDTARDLPDVSNALLSIGKKMEYGAIMPEIVRTWLQLDSGDIGDKPMYLRRSRPQAALGALNGALREIEDGDIRVSAKEQIVNQC